MGPMSSLSGATVGLGVRVEFCHAALQHIADRAGVDLLHIKGIAFDAQWRQRPGGGSDADVLVRPSQVPRFLEAVETLGWRRRSRFHTGSPFEHAQTYWHDHFAYADIHRFFPGLGQDEATFDVLWADRGQVDLAGQPCAIPSPAAQALISVLNKARNRSAGTGQAADAVLQDPIADEVQALVPRLDAAVGWAAARGRLDEVRHHRDHDLWHAVTQQTGRVHEWRARVTAAPTLRAKALVLLRAPLVNIEHLANTRGHAPTPWEVGVEFVDRLRRASIEAGRGAASVGRRAADAWRARRGRP